MKISVARMLLGPVLILTTLWSSEGHAAAGRGATSGPNQVHFRDDDLRAQRIARRLLAKDIAQEEHRSPGPIWLRTAWVNVSPGQAPTLFVMYGCSPTGNCGLYGFEPTSSGWKLVLNSLAQRCSILSSSHGGRRDISAYMHGSATEGTIKTYLWRRNRYVRVSVRDIVFRK